MAAMAKANTKGNNLGRLEAAAEELALVRVSRSIRRSGESEGFVVRIGKEWILLALIDPSIAGPSRATTSTRRFSPATARAAAAWASVALGAPGAPRAAAPHSPRRRSP